MMGASARVGFGAGCFALLIAARAFPKSSPEPIDLRWSAPAACPSRALVLAEVARVLGDSQQAQIPVSVVVEIAGPRTVDTGGNADGHRWQAAMRIDVAHGHSERRFGAESCEAIASAAALIMAVAVEGGAPTFANPPASDPPASPSPLSPVESPVRSPESTAAPTAGTRHAPVDSQLVVTVGGLVDAGAMPRPPAGGIEAGVGWRGETSGWTLRAIGGASYFPGTGASAVRTGEGGEFRLATVGARVCASKVRGRLDLGPCLGGEVDVMNASGSGPTATFEAGSASGIWASALGAVVATWTFPRPFALFARGEALIPLGRQRFVLMPGAVLVHQPAAVGIRAAVGVELRFF